MKVYTILILLITSLIPLEKGFTQVDPSGPSSTATNCANYTPDNPCRRDCGTCDDNGNYVEADNCDGVDQDSIVDVDISTCNLSSVDNMTYNYIHDVKEYSSTNNTGGCAPCGASSAGPSNTPRLSLTRFHKFRNMGDRGSFGPGIFMSWDIYFRLYEVETGTAQIDMFFAKDLSMRRYFKQGNEFCDTFARTSRCIRLLDAAGQVTTSFSEAKTAELETFTHRLFKFEIFALDESVKAARLVSVQDTNDYAIKLSYKHQIDAELSDNTQKWIVKTISDPSNRTLQFEYFSTTKKGQWVISKVTLPNSHAIHYQYGAASDGGLEKVIYPDGTESTFSYTVNSDNKTEARIFEAGEKGTHRLKTVYFHNNFNANAKGRDQVHFYNHSSLLIDHIKMDNELVYKVYQRPNSGNSRRIYEGGNKFRFTGIAVSGYYSEWKQTDPSLGYEGFTATPEENYIYNHWRSYNGNAQGRPPNTYDDSHGNKLAYSYNADNALIKKIYQDGTKEDFSRNEFRQKTRYRDRLGRVTRWEYDQRGNMLKKTVGLKARACEAIDEQIPGLRCQVYDWVSFHHLPTDFDALTTVQTLSVPNLRTDVSDRDQRFALLFTGKINITEAGEYDFFLTSSDGSRLYIDDQLVINKNGHHSLVESSSAAPINLTAGKHSIRVECFIGGGSSRQLQVKFSGPDSENEKIKIPDTAFSHFCIGEELGENDFTTPETAELSYSYYPTGHQNQHLLHTETDANGNTVEYIYNADNLLQRIIEPDDFGSGTHTRSSFTYDDAKRLHTSTDALGRTTAYKYDRRNRVIKTTYNDTSTEIKFYGIGSDANQLVKSKDRNGNTTKYQYDVQGRSVVTIKAYSVMNSDGSSENINSTDIQSKEECSYLAGTSLKKSCRKDGDLTEYFYDYRNRLVETRRHADADSVLVSSKEYKKNKLFKSTDAYDRDTFYAYRFQSDTALVRTVKETLPATLDMASNEEVEQVSRNYANNASWLVTDYVLDAQAQTIALVDPRGIRSETDYDSRGRKVLQINAVNSLAQISQTIYDANSNVIEVRKPRYFSESINDRDTISYTNRNLPDNKTVAAGSTIAATASYTYHNDRRLHTYTDFKGNTSQKDWHQCCGRLQSTTDEAGHKKISNNDFYGHVTHSGVVDRTATISDFHDLPNEGTIQEVTTQFDSRHRPIARTIWLQSLGTVDPNNVPIATDPAAGLTTRYLYYDELQGHPELSPLLAELNADGINFNANNNGSATIIINPAGDVSLSVSDGLGRKIASGAYDKIDYEKGIYTLMTWSTVVHDTVVEGLLETKTISALNFENKAYSDGAGRRLKVIDAKGKMANFEYDANRNLVKSRDANNIGQDCQFDPLNRDTSCTDTTGRTTSRTYDLNNNIISQIDAKQKSNSCLFDERNRKSSYTDRIEGTTDYLYDENSNLLSITDDLNKVTSYVYDSRNLKVKTTYADHLDSSSVGEANYGIREASFDALRRSFINTDQLGDTVTYLYDLASRVTAREYRLKNSDQLESTDTFTYDPASRPLTATKGRYNNTVSYTYDGIGRRKTETITMPGNTDSPTTAFTTSCTYDHDNRETNCRYPAGNNVVKTYTSRNQLETVGFNAGKITSFTYDDGRREISRTFGNGLVSNSHYNADNTKANIELAGKADLSFSYNYDANKNVISETSNGDVMTDYSWNATFDDADRIIQWNRPETTGNSAVYTSQSWDIDTIGNWKTVTTDGIAETRTHNNTHELTSISGTTEDLKYDGKGNLTLDAKGNTQLWDIDNHLQSVNNIMPIAEYTYDALGRRLKKSLPQLKDTLFISHGQRVIEEYEAPVGQTFTLARSYVHGTYVDDILATLEGSGNLSYKLDGTQQIPQNKQIEKEEHSNSIWFKTNDPEAGIYTARDSQLRAWFKLDESSGTLALDASGNGNHGTIGQNTIIDESGSSLVADNSKAYRFDSTSSPVTGKLTGLTEAKLTISYWSKTVRDEQVHNYQTYLRLGDAISFYSSKGAPYTRVFPRGAYMATGGNTMDGNWHHFVLTLDKENNRAKMYKDGVLRSSKPWNHDNPVDKYSIGGNRINGSLDEIRIYSRVLTHQEIRNLSQGISSDRQMLLQQANIKTKIGKNVASTSGLNLADGTWYQLIHTKNAYEQRIYINGILQGHSLLTQPLSDSPLKAYTGFNASAGSPFFTGQISDLKTYSQLKSSEQAQLFFNRENQQPLGKLQVNYHHTDRQYNVRGLTNSRGDIVELYNYSVYGKRTVIDKLGNTLARSAYNNNYGFTGRYIDEETGLWYFRARYYSDELGRFISRDPLGYVDGMSLYAGYFAQRFEMDPSGTIIFVAVLVWSDLQKTEADIDSLTGERTYGNLPQSHSKAPEGTSSNTTPCPSGQWPLQVVHSDSWSNILQGTSSININFQGSYSDGSAEGTVSAGGAGSNSRIGYHIIGLTISEYTKDSSCGCNEKVGCIRFTVILRTVVDRPFPIYNVDYTKTISVTVCGDGDSDISVL